MILTTFMLASLIAAPVDFALSGQGMGPGPGLPVGVCSTPQIGNILNEGFEGTGLENSWDDVFGSPDYDATPSSPAPASLCSQVIKTGSAAAGSLEGIERDFSPSLTFPVTIEYDLRVNSVSFASDWQNHGVIGNWTSSWSTGPGTGYIQRVNSTTYQFRVSSASVSSARLDFPLEEWFHVKIYHAATANESYLELTIDGTTTREYFTRGAGQIGIMRVATQANFANGDVDLEVDNLHVSDGS